MAKLAVLQVTYGRDNAQHSFVLNVVCIISYVALYDSALVLLASQYSPNFVYGRLQSTAQFDNI